MKSHHQFYRIAPNNIFDNFGVSSFYLLVQNEIFDLIGAKSMNLMLKANARKKS